MSGSGQSGPGRTFDLVAIAASLGGIPATRDVLSRLPADFPAPVVVVQHRSPDPDLLVPVLQRRIAIAVVGAPEGVEPQAGSVYVAEAARQLVLDRRGHFAYASGAFKGCRADALFASAAQVHGERLLAVVLTGALDDGAAGVVAVEASGGRVIAQNRATAASFGMPGAAIATGCVDFVLPLEAIGHAIVTLTMLPASAELFRVGRPSWAVSAA